MVVKVYSTKICPWCVRAKEFLKEHNIEFEEVNVEEDEAAGKEMEDETGKKRKAGGAVFDRVLKIYSSFAGRSS